MSNWIIRELQKRAWAEEVFPEIDPASAKLLERGVHTAVVTGGRGAIEGVYNHFNKDPREDEGKCI